MEQEFKRTGLTQSPAFGKLVIQNLRKQREEHPYVDMAAGMLPIVGGMQAGMDVTDESKTPFDRGMSALSFVPGGKLLGAASKYIPGIDKLRGAGESAVSYMGDVVDINKIKKQKQIAKRLKESQEQPLTPEEMLVDKTGQIPVPDKPPQSIIDDMQRRAATGDQRAQEWIEKFGGDNTPYEAEEIFQKPDIVMTPAQRKAANDAIEKRATEIAAQWLKDNPE